MASYILLFLLILSGCSLKPVDTVCIGSVIMGGVIYLDCGTSESWEKYNREQERKLEEFEAKKYGTGL